MKVLKRLLTRKMRFWPRCLEVWLMGSLNLCLDVPWCETWYVNLFGFVFGKMYLKWPFCENEILAYMLTSLINGKVELIPWLKIWYVKLFGFVFGKMRVLEWPLSRQWDCSQHGYKFDKYEGWIFPQIGRASCRERVFVSV